MFNPSLNRPIPLPGPDRGWDERYQSTEQKNVIRNNNNNNAFMGNEASPRPGPRAGDHKSRRRTRVAPRSGALGAPRGFAPGPRGPSVRAGGALRDGGAEANYV